MYYCCGITDKGIMPHNEDAVLLGDALFDSGSIEINLEAPFAAAVSDGVSGENSGEVAARLCLEMLREIPPCSEEKLRSSVMDIHRRLAERGRNSDGNENMQTTLCGLFFGKDGSVVSVNVGDSRLYHFRSGKLRQLSRDQSLVQLLYEEGTISHEERRSHARKNIIFPVMGSQRSEPVADIQKLEELEPGDLLLLCSDGLSDSSLSLDIQEILELPKSLMKRLEMLVERSLQRGCKDNISIVAIVYNNNI